MSTQSARARGTIRPRVALRGLGLLAGVALAVTACGSSSSPSASSTSSVGAGGSPPAATGAVLATASSPEGTILVDGQGRTVYLFAADAPGKSNCSASCLSYWPIVTAPATLPASVSGVNATLGVLTRSDGSKQLTVNGWPVYTYAGDTGPGSQSGQGKNLSGGLWWVVSPAGAPITTSGSTSPQPSASKSSSGGGGWA
jgi:predicted lipoprotein with Yx(FWY)xxD motif